MTQAHLCGAKETRPMKGKGTGDAKLRRIHLIGKRIMAVAKPADRSIKTARILRPGVAQLKSAVKLDVSFPHVTNYG